MEQEFVDVRDYQLRDIEECTFNPEVKKKELDECFQKGFKKTQAKHNDSRTFRWFYAMVGYKVHILTMQEVRNGISNLNNKANLHNLVARVKEEVDNFYKTYVDYRKKWINKITSITNEFSKYELVELCNNYMYIMFNFTLIKKSVKIDDWDLERFITILLIEYPDTNNTVSILKTIKQTPLSRSKNSSRSKKSSRSRR
jgi:hypothetical protein